MMHRNRLAARAAGVMSAAVAAAVCGSASLARAGNDASSSSFLPSAPLFLQDSSPVPGEQTQKPTTVPAAGAQAAAEAAPAAAPPASPKPLMGLLDKAGVGKYLEDAGIQIYGHVEGSYTVSDSSPPRLISMRFFDFENDSPALNQIQLVVERKLDQTQAKFDVGGRMEWLYGTDSRLVHANGLFDYYGSGPTAPTTAGVFPTSTGPRAQFDLYQLYIDVDVPIKDKALLVRFGKFNTLVGYETTDPTTRPLYSTSYLYGFAEPLTHTGLLAQYAFTDTITGTAAITRGWNQALKDNNGDALDVMGQVAWTPNKKTNLYLTTILGPEDTDSGYWRFMLDGVAQYAYSDNLSFGGTFDYVYDAGNGNGTAQWGGVALYTAYKFDDHFTFNGRVEWYDDNNGFTTGAAGNYYEITAGVAIKPFPENDLGSNLTIRPEVRYDYSEHGSLDAGTDYDQFTFGVDGIFSF